jgi:two-component system CheB/CheR fusion protein
MGEPAKLPSDRTPEARSEASGKVTQLQRLESNPVLNSNRQLAAIVESSDDAILSKDVNGIIQSWNAGAQRIYGYTPDEIIGQHVSILTPRGDLDDTPEIMRRLLQGERIEHYETIRRTKDNQLLNMSLTISPLRDETGNIVGASAIGRDTTAQKRTQEALVGAEKMTTNARLAAAIAHEINNPLESVVNLLYLLEKHPSLDTVARRYAQMAQEEVGRISRLARKSLSFFRDSSNLSPVNVSELLQSLLELYAHKFKSRGIQLQQRLESVKEVHASAAELRQVFSNLISNAIDATPEGGTVTVHAYDNFHWAEPVRAGVRVLVQDNGHGVQPEHRRNLFDPFFTTKGSHGTGLGLWVSSGLVKKYSGSLRARSSVKAWRTGSCFMVFLPLTQPESNHQNSSRLFVVPGEKKP